MRICFLAYLRGFGGAQRQIITIANAMCNRGHDVTLISLSDNNCVYELNDKINYLYIEDKGKGLYKIYNRFRKLKKILINQKYDIIVNFWYQSAYFCAFMKNKIKSKIVYSERSNPNDKQYNGILGIIRKITLNKIDGFVFQTTSAKKYFDINVQRKSIIIPNPVFIDKKKYPRCAISKKIVTVGRLHPQKNIQLLINSFSKITSMFPDYILEIYGDGELKNDLENLINEKKLKNKVFLMGAKKDVHKKIADASLFVLSSNYEGMPNALLEAMALELPCISTNWEPGGIYDIITNEKNGIIVPANDEKKLSDAITKLLSNKKLANKIGHNAMISTKKYEPEKVYDLWEGFLIGLRKSK